jgi:O-antigen ligase
MTVSLPVSQADTRTSAKARSGLAGITMLDVMLAFILMGPLAVLTVAGRTPSLFWIDVVIVVFSAFALSMSWAKPTDRTFRLPPAVAWAILYILICAASLLITQDILVSIATLKLRTLPIAVFLLASRQIRNRSDVDHFFHSLAWFGLALAAISLYNWYKFSTGVLVLSDEFGEKDMLQLSFGRSNYLASMFVLLIPPMIAVIQNRRKKLAFLVHGVALVLVVIALLFTQSRGSLISLTVGLLAWVFLSFSSAFTARKVFAALAVVILVVATTIFLWEKIPDAVRLGLTAAFGLLWSEAARGNLGGGRTELWVAALKGAWDSRLFGIGLGNQAIFYARQQMTPSAHSVYLETLLETGIVGVIALFGFLYVFGKTLWSLWKECPPSDRRFVGAMLATFVTAMVNISQEPSFWGPQYSCLFWMMMGVVYAWRRVGAARATPTPEAS